MAPNRPLPVEPNPLMTKENNIPPYETLVARRRLGQTDLAVKAGQVGSSNATKAKNLGTFDYAHLRAPLPKGITSGIFKPSPASYFLMRRSHDGYISATGMFKATFPSAEASEEEEERKYIKSLETTSPDETAGNVWIPPQHALELAEEYEILPWIKALLDNTPIDINPTKDATPKTISPPPKFLMPQESLTAPTPTRGRPRRSASPSKIASPRKATGTRSRKAKSESVKSESVEPASIKTASKNLEESLKAAATETKAPAEEGVKEEVKEDPVVRVHVDTDVEVKGDVETTHTHVEVEMPAGSPELPLPEDTAAMIQKAKEMVEAAVAGQNGEVVNTSKKSKRKAEEIEDEENEESAVVPAPAKKAKTSATTELRKERIKTRALLGISATLAIGAAVQYAFNIL
ncbi:DNA-binding domain of Mlu1-box binding protein MBP1 [Mollisia scopiformis]|uniref:DNA-binding domain of Mlu1-box binding protein MBP1 n=1 Tax=Mollisia scopiformis TaxID=149040 RepID=A0A194X854_MOLSC|nr:DNA-binding domain of Mlu1-box binding protein MBP1 [Mollisia scopiformis]KUJ16350.1 DNA-binding domain of Mlu1-box binding protein MBP1 [Mollisia scopiformis]